MNPQNTIMRQGILSLLVAAVGVLLPLVIKSAILLSIMTQALIYAIAALGVGFLLRQNDHVSFGNAIYYGLAGYGIGIYSDYFGMSTGLAVIVVIISIGVLAFIMGLVIVRAPGIAFAMISLAIGQVFYLMASKARSITGGEDGLVIQTSCTIFGLKSAAYGRPASMFIICWLTLVFVVFLLSLLLKTRFGPLTEAIRDNEERARFIGFKTLIPRAAVYAISAMVCSAAGVLSALYSTFVSPDSMHWSLSGAFLIAALLGGRGMLTGPAIGAVIYFLLQDLLSEVTSHWLSILGIWLILVLVFWPGGISGGLMVIGEKLRTLFGDTSGNAAMKP